MPEIQIKQATESAVVNLRESQVGSIGFGANVAQPIAQGLENVSGSLLNVAENLDRASRQKELIQREKKTRDDVSWTGEAAFQLKNYLNEWMTNPDNNGKDTFSSDFMKLYNDQVEGYQADAPSTEARQMFTNHMQSFVSSKYDQALDITERTKTSNALDSINKQVDFALDDYRKTGALPGSDPDSELLMSMSQIHDNVNQTFGKLAPKLRDRVTAEVASDFILAASQQNPDLAQQILDQSPSVDEKQRLQLQARIDQQSEVKDIVERDSFNRLRDNHLVQVEHGVTRETIPLDQYKLYYDSKEAVIKKREDDQKVDVLLGSRDMIDSISGMAASYQVEALNKYHDKIDDTTKENIYSLVMPQIKQEIQLQSKNPVAWLQQYNPEVKTLSERASNSPESDRVVSLNERNSSILKYQGPPPVDASSDDKKLYLDVPLSQRHLMRSDEAESSVATINSGKPGETMQKIAQVLEQYPDDTHKMIAFNDLVTVPSEGKKLRQEYQLVWQNKDAWWIDTFVGALQQSGPLKSMSEEKTKDLEKFLDNDARFASFKRAIIGDNFQRAHEIEGYRNGIMMYARAMMTSGMRDRDAMKLASDRLIGETLGFADVNGSPLAILKQRPLASLPPRTDEEVADLGRRMSIALQYIDPRKIDQRNFPGLRQLGEEPRVERMQALRNMITSRGFFQTSPDGQGATLYFHDDSGLQFQVSDKSGNPFTVDFENVPKFEHPMPQLTHYGDIGGPGLTGPMIKELPQKTYQLLQKSGNVRSGFSGGSGGMITTNWPVDVKFIR